MNRDALIRRIEENLADERSWGDAIRVFARERAFADIHALLRARHDLTGDAASFTLRMLVTLLAEGSAPGACRWLFGRSSPDSAFHGILAFAAGMEAGREFRLDEASALLREGAWRATLAQNTVFRGDTRFRPLLIRMLRDANLIEPSGYDAAGVPAGTRLPEITAVAGPLVMTGDTMVVAACDWRYFERYHERFLASLGRGCPDQDCLLHLINPGAGTAPALEALARARPRLWITREDGPPYKAYYASNRFLIAERVMDRLGCHVVTVDLDGVFGESFPEALERARSLDVAYLRVPDETTLTCQISAAFLFARNSAAGRRFLRRNAAYLVRKLATDPIWMVDQAALYRTVCLTRDDPGRIADINGLLEAPPGGRIDLRGSLVGDHLLSEETRQDGRAPFGVRPLEFTAELKPLYETGYSVWDWDKPAAGSR